MLIFCIYYEDIFNIYIIFKLFILCIVMFSIVAYNITNNRRSDSMSTFHSYKQLNILSKSIKLFSTFFLLSFLLIY